MSEFLTGFKDKSHLFSQDYVTSLSDRRTQISAEADSLLSQWSEECAQRLCEHCHNLSGSGTTHGYPAISHAGKELEDLLITILTKGASASETQLQKISEYSKHISEQISAVVQPNITSSIPNPDKIDDAKTSDLGMALRASQAQLLALDQHAIVSIADTNGLITYANNKFCGISKYSHEELVGQNHRLLNSGFHPKEFFKDMWSTIKSGKTWQGEIRNRTKDGEFYWVESTIMPFLDEAGKSYQYISVRTDITPIMESEITLQKSKKEAENANQAKSEFLSSMSHELRTPLNAILGFAQLLEHDTINPITNDQRENVHHILKSGWHLLELINEVLDLSKIEAGKISLSMENVELNKVLEECFSLIGPLAKDNNIEVQNKIVTKHQSVFLYVDRTRLKQILLNLISNAVKYNSSNGSVTLNASEAKQGYLRIEVTDTGKGISDENKAQLFRPFERAGAEYTTIEGTGIGLVITKELVELMQGRIGLDSIPGKGSTFWVELKLATDIKQSTPENIGQEKEGKPATSSSIHTILYIEDNPANLDLVENILKKREGYELISAHNAELGLDLACAHNPDIILLDINLPGMNGHETLKQLQSMKETQDTPVLAVSANAMAGDIQKGLDAGFAEYITKPINIISFIEKLDTALSAKNSL